MIYFFIAFIVGCIVNTILFKALKSKTNLLDRFITADSPFVTAIPYLLLYIISAFIVYIFLDYLNLTTIDLDIFIGFTFGILISSGESIYSLRKHSN